MSVKNSNEIDDQEIELLIETHRSSLLGFLISSTACKATAEDLVQETCITIWEKRDSYESETNFKAWAFQIAFNLVRNHRRKKSKGFEKTLPDDELLEKIKQRYEELEDPWSTESKYLNTCLQELQPEKQKLMIRRYVAKVPVQTLASEWDLSANALSQLLFRLKGILQKCIKSKVRSDSTQL